MVFVVRKKICFFGKKDLPLQSQKGGVRERDTEIVLQKDIV